MREDVDRSLTLGTVPEELLLTVVRFLGAGDLLRFQCACRRAAALPVEDIWRMIAANRWEKWPRYRLTAEREEVINASFNNVCWRDRYLYYELETHRAALTMKELEALQLHLNFTPTAGGRGIETLRPAFFSQDFLLLPGYPPLPCKLAGPSSAARSTTGASALPALAIAESAGALSADECPQENADGIQHLPPYIPPPNVDHLLRQLKQLILTPLHRSRATWLSVSSRDARQIRIFEPPQHQAALLHIADFPVHFPEMEWIVYNDNVTIASCHQGKLGAFDRNGFLTVPDQTHGSEAVAGVADVDPAAGNDDGSSEDGGERGGAEGNEAAAGTGGAEDPELLNAAAAAERLSL